MVSRTDFSETVEILRRDPLRNIVLLKTLVHASPGMDIDLWKDGNRRAILLHVEQDEFDRQTYPETSASILLSGEQDMMWGLLRRLRQDEDYVFKLSSEDQRAVMAEFFTARRRLAFHSYTSVARRFSNRPHVAIESNPTVALYPLLREQNHEESWLTPLLSAEKAFTCSITQRGRPVSVCVAFHIDDGFWEIGGVYTVPDARGRGFGRDVVATALAELARRGMRSRYQVREENKASVGLAESLAMTRFLTLTHYSTEGPASPPVVKVP